METKREILSKLLDSQLTLAVSLHRAIAMHNITKESPLSGDLLNALLGVEALTNAIAALPLTTEEKAQNISISAIGTLHKVRQNEEWFTGYQALPHIGDDDSGW